MSDEQAVQIVTKQIADAAQEDMFDWEVAQQIIAELRKAGYLVVTAKARDALRSSIGDLLFDHGIEVDVPGGTNTLVDAVIASLSRLT